MRCIRGNLRVVAERESLIRMLHHSCLRVAGTYPGLPLGLFSALACPPLLQLFQRTLQALLLLALCAGLGFLCFRTTLVIPGITHLCYAPSCPLQMLTNGLLLEITSAACLRLNLRAVLHHLLQGDQSFLAERRQHLEIGRA